MNVYISSCCSSRLSRQMVKPYRAYFQNNIFKRYSNSGGHERHEDQERAPRAPSTAEEFERVAQEKAKQGLRSQTADKSEDAIKQATIGESSQFESIKETYKEPSSKGNSHKKEGV